MRLLPVAPSVRGQTPRGMAGGRMRPQLRHQADAGPRPSCPSPAVAKLSSFVLSPASRRPTTPSVQVPRANPRTGQGWLRAALCRQEGGMARFQPRANSATTHSPSSPRRRHTAPGPASLQMPRAWVPPHSGGRRGGVPTHCSHPVTPRRRRPHSPGPLHTPACRCSVHPPRGWGSCRWGRCQRGNSGRGAAPGLAGAPQGAAAGAAAPSGTRAGGAPGPTCSGQWWPETSPRGHRKLRPTGAFSSGSGHLPFPACRSPC